MKIYIQNHNWKDDYDFEQENKREVIYSEENILILKKKKYYSQKKLYEHYETKNYQSYIMLFDMNIYKDELATYIPYEHLVVKETEYKKYIGNEKKLFIGYKMFQRFKYTLNGYGLIKHNYNIYDLYLLGYKDAQNNKYLLDYYLL